MSRVDWARVREEVQAGHVPALDPEAVQAVHRAIEQMREDLRERLDAAAPALRAFAEAFQGIGDGPQETHPDNSSSPDTSKPYFLDLIHRIDEEIER